MPRFGGLGLHCNAVGPGQVTRGGGAMHVATLDGEFPDALVEHFVPGYRKPGIWRIEVRKSIGHCVFV